MKRYESYKDSGVKWLGEIPSHWEILPGLAVFKENKTKNTELSEKTVLSLSYGNIIIKKDIDEGLVPADYKGYQIVHPGYIIIRCTDLQNDKVSLRTGLVKNDGIITGAYLGLKVDGSFNSSYVHYFLHSWDITKEIYRHGSGLRQSLSWFDLRRLPILIPSREEQDKIVSYLNDAVSKIDEAIAQQQKMIDLLNERKQIIINNAVTKGLDPNVKMKPSGIDWIGDIPEHWEVIRIKYLLNESKERSESGKEEPLSMSQIYGLIPTKNMDTVPNMASTFVGAKKVKEGDLVFNKLKAHLGVFNVSKYEGLVSPDYAVYKSTGIANLSFLEYIFKTPACIHEFIKLITGVGAGLSRLYTSDLYSIYCALPSIEEQKKICDYIDERTKKIKETIINCQKQISLLQERKQIIINDVVTGKVKVI